MDEEQIVEPLFVVPATVARWETREVAALIADARLSPSTATTQIRRFAQKRWINTVGHRRSGPTAANLFAPSAVAAAKVLSVLTALGIEDMGSAAVPLSAWPGDQPRIKGYGPPIMAALAGTARGEWWVYQLTLFCGDQSGKLESRAWVYDPDASWRPSSEGSTAEMMPMASVTLHLRPLLVPLYTRMCEAAGGPLQAQAN